MTESEGSRRRPNRFGLAFDVFVALFDLTAGRRCGSACARNRDHYFPGLVASRGVESTTSPE